MPVLLEDGTNALPLLTHKFTDPLLDYHFFLIVVINQSPFSPRFSSSHAIEHKCSCFLVMFTSLNLEHIKKSPSSDMEKFH
jgi:hypothetical protein